MTPGSIDAPDQDLGPIDLARRPDFRLGRVLFIPSACRMAVDGGERPVQRRVMEVLVTLVDAGGRTVARDDLILRCWGARIVGEDAVNRIIAKVRDLARGQAPPPFVLETIPRVGFRLVAATDAATPETAAEVGKGPGAAAGQAARRAAWGRPSFWATWAAAALAVVVLAVAGPLLWRLSSPAPAAGTGYGVELAPFQPAQADPTLEHVAGEFREALARTLTEAGVDIAVRPDSPGQLRLAGAIDREGGALVLTARLEDRRSGRLLWSSRFDRREGTDAAFPDQTAATIAQVVRCGVRNRAAAHAEMSPALFALVLSSCEARRDDPARMLEIARRLVAAAPNLSMAHSVEAEAAGWDALESGSANDGAALRSIARSEADQALRLDPHNGEGFLALALSYADGGDWMQREKALEKARALDPDSTPARNAWVWFLREVGRSDEALDVSRAANAADPSWSAHLGQIALMSGAADDAESAQRALDRLEVLNPALARDLRWTIAFWWADLPTARSTVQALSPAADSACLSEYLDRLSLSRAAPSRGLPAACTTFELGWRVRMLAREGDLDGAFESLARARPLANDEPVFLFYPEMAAFRRDPRFMPLARRLGLVDYWRRSGHWPDFCAEPGLPRSCQTAAG